MSLEPDWNKFRKNIMLMFIFGILSYILGMVNFNIPGVDGAVSNLSEIPLLICLFHITNPFYAIGVSIFSAFITPAGGSFLSTFLMHSGALLISWGVYYKLNRLPVPSITLCIIWFFYVFIYYLILIFPLLIITNYLVGLNTDKEFFGFFGELFSAAKFEMITAAIISALYLLQYKIRLTLKEHQENLEKQVKDRTEELVSTIEELKIAQQHLVQSEKMASLGTLTSGVAHEINNPLNFIEGSYTILNDIKKELHVPSPEIGEKLDFVIRSLRSGLDKATAIVRALMTFSYRGESELVVSDINEIIDNTLLFLNRRFEEHEIEIVRNYQLTKDITVYPEKIHQLILSIVDNGLYALNLKNSETKKIIISTKEKNNNAVIQISNSGPAIPNEQLSQIFDPFFTTKSPGEGIGLGLSICYSIVREHRGRIRAENSPDGVIFTIEFPINKESVK